jgi:hypothetical protein
MNKTAKFMDALIKNSVSNDWVRARTEWVQYGLRYTQDKGVCICGQKHIARIVIIKNRLNSTILEIGYNCWLSVMGGEKLDTEFKRLRNQYTLYTLGIKLPTLYLILRNFESGRIKIEEVDDLVHAHFKSLSSEELERIKDIITKMEFVPDVVPIKAIKWLYKYKCSPFNIDRTDRYLSTLQGVGYDGKIYRLHRWDVHEYPLLWETLYKWEEIHVKEHKKFDFSRIKIQ